MLTGPDFLSEPAVRLIAACACHRGSASGSPRGSRTGTGSADPVGHLVFGGPVSLFALALHHKSVQFLGGPLDGGVLLALIGDLDAGLVAVIGTDLFGAERCAVHFGSLHGGGELRHSRPDV